jgi:predicted membrane protein
MSIEIISAVVGFILTLMILSYLIGDNPLFRIAVYLFIGVSSGYAATVIVYNVLLPNLNKLQTNDLNQLLLEVIPVVFGATLLAKLSPRISWIGNFAMAMLVGIGAAVALGGALLGTLIPQAQAAMDAFDLGGSSNPVLSFVEGGVMLVGAVVTLAAFQFGAKNAPDGTPKRNILVEWTARLGRLFIAVTFGVLFAGVYMSALTAMIERLSSILNFIRQSFGI